MDDMEKYLRSETYINPVSGRLAIKYFWKRKPAPIVRLTGPEPEQLAGLTLIEKDLRHARDWMRKAKALSSGHARSQTKDAAGKSETVHAKSGPREVFDEVKAFFVAALTFYAKCFLLANGRGAKASRDWLDAEYRKAHDLHMRFRHNFAAHSGDERLEKSSVCLILRPSKKSPGYMLVGARNQPDVLQSTDGEDLEWLIDHLAKKVVERKSKLHASIVEHHIQPKGSKFWENAADKKAPVRLERVKRR